MTRNPRTRTGRRVLDDVLLSALPGSQSHDRMREAILDIEDEALDLLLAPVYPDDLNRTVLDAFRAADLCLPVIDGDPPTPETATRFIDMLSRSGYRLERTDGELSLRPQVGDILIYPTTNHRDTT